MENVFIGTVVVAVTELLRRLELRDYRAAIIIVVAGLVGALAGFFHLGGVNDPVNGLLSGLGAAGIVRIGQAIGGLK